MSKRRKTHEEYINEVKELVGDRYTVLGKYTNNKSKILMRDNTCGTEWAITPLSFLQGRRCPKCAGVQKKTQTEFEDKVAKITSGEYEVLGSYTNNYTPTMIKHNLCGHEFKTQPKNFLSGSRCPKCAGNMKKTLLPSKEK